MPKPRVRPGPARAGRFTLTLGVTALTLVLAACGSQLDPGTVAQVNGQAGGAQGGTVPGGDAGAQADGSLPGSTSGGGDPGTTGGGDTGGGDSGGGGDAPSGEGENAPTGDDKKGSCDGFKNQTGVTNDKIVIGNVSDVSGPVPGLFESAQDAVRAYVAYFNSGSDICGRKLELKAYDSRTDAGADQQGYTAACDETFAVVGSMSAFDSGGAATAEGCGIPDLRSAAVTSERSDCATCFGAQSTNPDEFENAVPDFIAKNYGDAKDHAAMLFINAGAAAENGKTQVAAMEKRGMTFDYVQGIDISEFNYAPYVQQMKDKGIKSVQFIGANQQAVRLAQAMQQQDFEPEVYLLDPTMYNPDYVETGGSAVEGTVIFMNFVPFEEADSNSEMQLYTSWLQQVKPGADPTFFGVFSWSAARLFVERAIALGGKLDRGSLVADLKGVDNWTANGMHAPQRVGPKRVGPCWRFVQLNDGKWVPKGGTKYSCSGVSTAS